MGVKLSVRRHFNSSNSPGVTCYPSFPLCKIDKNNWHEQENQNIDRPFSNYGLVFEVDVLPDKLKRGRDDGSWFFWTDGQFIPFNDAFIVASSSTFMPRQFDVLMPIPYHFNGKVLLYNLQKPPEPTCKIYGKTSCSVFPKVQPNPIGDLVCFCGTGEVSVMGLGGDVIFSKPRDLSNAVHVFCAIASDGVTFAYLKRGMNVFFLDVTSINDTMYSVTDSIRCHTVCPNFLPGRSSKVVVQCKFSPNCKYLAVSSNHGYLFVVKVHHLEKYCIVCPEITEKPLSAASAFDFNPRHEFQLMALGILEDEGLVENKILIVNIELKKICQSREIDEKIDCLIYSRDGCIIAIGLHNFDIIICSSDDLSFIYEIKQSSLCTNELSRRRFIYPAIHCLSFSQNSEHILSTSCDGKLRMWRLHVVSTLQELSRDTILTSLPIDKVKELLLPEKIKNFILFKYF